MLTLLLILLQVSRPCFFLSLDDDAEIISRYGQHIAPRPEHETKSDPDWANLPYTPCFPYTWEDTKKVHKVYFWPQRPVELKCFCNMQQQEEATIKIWRYQQFNIDKLQESRWFDPNEFGNLIDMIKPIMKQYLVQSPLVTGSRPPPEFAQHDGLLSISNPGFEVQGIYNCYDNKTRQSVEWIYLLIAIMPPAMVPCMFAHAHYAGLLNYTNPGKFWEMLRFFFKTTKKHQSAPCQQYYTETPRPPPVTEYGFKTQVMFLVLPFDAWHYTYTPVRANFEVPRDYRGRDPVISNTAASLEWSTWSQCSAKAPYSGLKSREGHCYIRMISTDLPINFLGEDFYYLAYKILYADEDYHEKKGEKEIYFDRLEFDDHLFITAAWQRLTSLLKQKTFEDGIPMFAGIILQLFCGYDSVFIDNRCLRPYFIFFAKALVSENYKDSSTYPIYCFSYGVSDKRDHDNRPFFVGGYYIEWQKCMD